MPENATDRQAPPRAKVSLYFESRYRKLVRDLPQTIFYCPDCKGDRRRRRGCERCGGHGKLTRDSVQELIGRAFLPAFRAREGKFHGAGREDVDVRMLGAGRPFVYEVVHPRVLDVDVEALRQRIVDQHQGRLELVPFVRVSRPRVAFWKESKFDKVYGAEIELADDVDPARVTSLAGRTLPIVQRTPQRVAHRRADLAREREVVFRRTELREPRRLWLEVQCAHGTYVKEWISGEEGRTEPSLGDLLGTGCRCLALDVLEIVMAPPPGHDRPSTS